MNKYYLTVDPGLGGTALAFWDEVSWKEIVPPTKTEVITAKKGDWIDRSSEICDEFFSWISLSQPEKIWIEYPGLHQSAGGMASATRGDVFKLMWHVGRLTQICHSIGVKFIPLEVNIWKGQMTKEAVIKRICHRLSCPLDTYPDHIADAVGMGLYLKGCLNQSGLTREIINVKSD